ncbi:MAG TPA: hypothetical protein VJN68_03620 [Burkholderiaceae bacterium]|nr:hypothetical protein [Burkholderiaceae bacterium]
MLAVAVEPVVVDEDVGPDTERAGERLRALTHQAFEHWESILATALRSEESPRRARRLGALSVAAIEGTVAMCRAARSAQALEDVQRELESMLRSAIQR